jgi:hypothetical protein
MKMHKWLIFGLALVLAFTLTIAIPGLSQAQRNGPAVSSDNAAPGYDRGYYNYDNNGYAYCPTGPGYGSSARAPRNYDNRVPRSWNRDNRNGWRSRNNHHAGGYRGGMGYCW